MAWRLQCPQMAREWYTEQAKNVNLIFPQEKQRSLSGTDEALSNHAMFRLTLSPGNNASEYTQDGARTKFILSRKARRGCLEI